ncbi:MAG: non-canonical purine NTP pyrophosphatase [Bacillota bacterium]
MRILYGTGNQAKLETMRSILADTGIEVVGPDEVGIRLPAVQENGRSPLENARLKAWAYFRAARMPAFSCDSGLYIEGLDDDLQPGTHVRNVGGRKLDDEQMIEYYSGLARSLGGQCVAQYRNAICLILSEDTVYEHMGDDISGVRFLLSSKAHEKRRPGFPLDSISVEIGTGRYYIDMDSAEISSIDEGFRAFFDRFVPRALMR